VILAFIGILGSVVGLVGISYIAEALRRAPNPPRTLSWAPDIPIRYVDLDGTKVRCITTGSGPNLVLLHTLRTQLDIFEKIVPILAKHFTVHAFDYPGHGWSDIPRAKYAPKDFYSWVDLFLEVVDIRQAIVVGLSIGATISLVLAARHNPRVAKVVAINSYDSWPGGSIRRSSITARLTLSFSDIPVLGATFMRLRTRFAFNRVLWGGVASRKNFPADLAEELYVTGARPGHYRAFLSLLRHERRWRQAREEYPLISVPALLVYGQRDWAPRKERQSTQALVPHVRSTTVPNASHFLSLDQPEELANLIIDFFRS
jgi:pimeloyl-ACP methyl ester carboxylesterase